MKQVLPQCLPEVKLIRLTFCELGSEHRVVVYNLSLILVQMVLDFCSLKLLYLSFHVNKDMEKMNVLFSVLADNYMFSI